MRRTGMASAYPPEAWRPPAAWPADGSFVDQAGNPATRWDADEAVTSLYAAHYRSLVRLSALLLRDAEVAEEVVQDAFVAMHGAWRRLRDPDKALAYLRQSVVNRSRSALRRRATSERYLPAFTPASESAEDSALDRLDRTAVAAALADLPVRQREVVVLRYYSDLGEAEIAAAMGISRGAVKSHASRAIAHLRQNLESRP